MQKINLVAWPYIGLRELVWKLSLIIKISLRVSDPPTEVWLLLLVYGPPKVAHRGAF